jgi:TldD protein
MPNASTALALAKDTLLAPAGLGEQEIERVLSRLGGAHADEADLYFEETHGESWRIEDGIVKDAGFALSRGVGLRAVSGERTGYAYTSVLSLPQLLDAASVASEITRSGSAGTVAMDAARATATPPARYGAQSPLLSLADPDKVAYLRELEARIRALDPRIEQVFVTLAGTHSVVLVVGKGGQMVADVRPLVRLQVMVIAIANGRRESASVGGGGRYDYPTLIAADRGMGMGREAVRMALLNLEAEDAPAGTMTVVLGPGWPGILLHEAIGHGLEGDFNRKGTSAFAGRLGQRVASPLCTVVDDGTLPDRRGSLSVDDEGTPTGRTVLIEQGILTGYLQDQTNARLMGVAPTGNGRRQSFAHRPMPRMTNTFLLAGESAPEGILAGVEKGMYLANFSGGQVDITSGKFVFTASEAYLIEGGRIGRPVKGATLIGDGPTALKQISAVGCDLKLDDGVGTCGKEGQQVPVGVGLPTIRLDGITVGGTRR